MPACFPQKTLNLKSRCVAQKSDAFRRSCKCSFAIAVNSFSRRRDKNVLIGEANRVDVSETRLEKNSQQNVVQKRRQKRR